MGLLPKISQGAVTMGTFRVSGPSVLATAVALMIGTLSVSGAPAMALASALAERPVVCDTCLLQAISWRERNKAQSTD
jgi:hypothetical protein